MRRYSQEAPHIVCWLPTCLLMSCTCLLRTCVLSSGGWQWRPGGQTPGLPHSPTSVVPRKTWLPLTVRSWRGQDDKVWITLFNQISVLGSAGSWGRGTVFLHLRPCNSKHLSASTQCNPLLFHMWSLRAIVPGCDTEESWSPCEIGTKTKKVSWPSDTDDSPKLHLHSESLGGSFAECAVEWNLAFRVNLVLTIPSHFPLNTRNTFV